MQRRELLRLATAVLGGAVSASVAQGLLAGSVAGEPITRNRFSADQRAMASTLAELIIPKTDTPGAIDAGVPAFIELMVAQWYTATERKIFFDGLDELDAFCTRQYGHSFLQSDNAQQTAALQDAEQRGAAYRGPVSSRPMAKDIDEHKPFFSKIKELTVLGYYTSEVGATQELVYEPMPMRYDGDYPYAKVKRQFSW